MKVEKMKNKIFKGLNPKKHQGVLRKQTLEGISKSCQDFHRALKQWCSSVIIMSSIRLLLQTGNKSVMQTISKVLNRVKQMSRKVSAALFKEHITSKRTQNRAQRKGMQFRKGF